MKRLLISTLGFEESFLIRFLLRSTLSPGDVLLIILPSIADERATKAYREVEGFLTKYMPGVTLETIQVPVSKVYQAVAIIAQKIRSFDVDGVIVNLSGGMRILILETLAAVKMVFGDHANVEVELEGKHEVISFKPSIMNLKMPTIRQIHILNVMRELGKEATLKKISERLNIPRSSVYKEIIRMEKEGFVTRINDKHFVLTDLGLAWTQGERY